MNAETAVIVGAAIGSGGGIVGAFLGWAGARTQARAQVAVAQVKAEVDQQAEVSTMRRTAYAAFVSAADAVRSAMNEMQKAMDLAVPADRRRAYDSAEAARDARKQAFTTATWALRLMISHEEQQLVTDLVQAVTHTSNGLDEWGGLALASAPPGEISHARREFSDENVILGRQLLRFAGEVHQRLYAPPAPPMRWRDRRSVRRQPVQPSQS